MALLIKSIKNVSKTIDTPYVLDTKNIKFVFVEDCIKLIKSLREAKEPKNQLTKNRISLIINNYNKFNNKCKCEICGIKAHYAKTDGNYFRLYHYDKFTNSEVVFNIDHIKPKSKGGKDSLDNLQLTCVICNSNKSNIIVEKLPIIKLNFIECIKSFF